MKSFIGHAMRYLIALFVMVALLYGGRIGLKSWDRAQARSLLAALRKSEDPGTFYKLATLLNRQTLPKQLGNEVMQALVSPKIVVRDHYIAGRPVVVGIGGGRDINLPRLIQEFSGTALAGAQTLDSFGGRKFPGPEAAAMLQVTHGVTEDGLVAPLTNVGIYHARIVLHFKLWPESRAPGSRAPQEGPVYQCDFESPINLSLVSASEIKPISLASNPELDASMQRAFSALSIDQGSGRNGIAFPGWDGLSIAENARLRHGVFSGTPRLNPSTEDAQTSMEIQGATQLRYCGLPMGIAMRAKFRNANGGEKTSPSFKLVEQEGQSGTLTLNDLRDLFETLSPGEHHGELILFTDSSLAFENPFVSRIWNGTLSFPVSFDAAVKTNQAGPGSLGSHTSKR